MLVIMFNVGVDTADEVAHGSKCSAPDALAAKAKSRLPSQSDWTSGDISVRASKGWFNTNTSTMTKWIKHGRQFARSRSKLAKGNGQLARGKGLWFEDKLGNSAPNCDDDFATKAIDRMNSCPATDAFS
jgi:hypothetical protein